MGSEATRQDLQAPHNQQGRRLGDFLLEKKVGQGGMGEVYRARQLSLDRTVAVKVLSRQLAAQTGFVERFQREAKAAANIVHPNVLQIYAYGIDDGTPYFAMEYVEGEDLQQRVRRLRKLPVHEIVDTAIAVASALGAAHEKGVIHRDVKPSNVMIDPKGNVKVMDFGLAKATSANDLTSSGVIMGTPNYLSPEQGRGDAIDGRADLYSLGVVLYEMLAGDLPFRADTPAGLIFKHVYEEPIPLGQRCPEVAPFLAELVKKLLAKDPAERYASAQALVDDLREYAQHREHYDAGGERRSSTSGAKEKAPDGATAETLPEGVTRSEVDRNAETAPAIRRSSARHPAAHDTRPPSIVVQPSSQAPLWVLVFLVVVAAAGFGAFKAGLLHKYGLVRSDPILQLAATDIGFPRLSARLESLDGTVSREVRSDASYRIPTGDYTLTVERQGYKRIQAQVRIDEQDGKARLATVTGSPFAFTYEPVDELRAAYETGRAALEKGRATLDEKALEAARSSFDVARTLDPAYRVAASEKTADELHREAVDLLDKAKGQVEHAKAELVLAKNLVERKDWRSLRDAAKGRSDEEWVTLQKLAERSLEASRVAVQAIERARESGDFGSAEVALAALDRDDPFFPGAKELVTKVAALKVAREGAFRLARSATTREALAVAKAAFDAYVAQAPRDEAAASELAKIADRLSVDQAQPLDAAIRERQWARADDLLKVVEKDSPAHPKLKAWREAVAMGKREDAVRAAVAALDAAVRANRPENAIALLDGNPAMQREREAFLGMGEAGARFVASAHEVSKVEIVPSADKSRWEAKVASVWRAELTVDGEKVVLARPHALELALVAGGWKFTKFTLLDAERRGEPGGQGSR